MRRFKSIEHTQRFLAVHGTVQNLFRVGRHHLKAVHHRLLQAQAFSDWRGDLRLLGCCWRLVVFGRFSPWFR